MTEKHRSLIHRFANKFAPTGSVQIEEGQLDNVNSFDFGEVRRQVAKSVGANLFAKGHD